MHFKSFLELSGHDEDSIARGSNAAYFFFFLNFVFMGRTTTSVKSVNIFDNILLVRSVLLYSWQHNSWF
jgi:hypothetical protein